MATSCYNRKKEQPERCPIALLSILAHFVAFDLNEAEQYDDKERGSHDAEVLRVAIARTVARPADNTHYNQIDQQ